MLHRLMDRLARGLSWAAALCLVIMMGVTVVDVVLRGALRTPVFGTYDIVEVMLVGVIFLALPEVFLREQHVTVDVVDQIVRGWATQLLKIIGALLSLGFVAVLGWNMLGPAGDAWRFGETTLDLKIPVWVFWGPMLLGIAVSALAMIALLSRLLRERADVG
jgi:TRAP-type C4-dicarboxylate transport system permease small subunit